MSRPGYVDKRGNWKARKARRVWLLLTFDPDLGPDTARCRLAYPGYCEGVVTDENLRVDRIVMGGSYRRDNIQPSCTTCSDRQGGLAGIATHAALLDEYHDALEVWRQKFEAETFYTYDPAFVRRELRKARGAAGKRRGVQGPQVGGGRNEVYDFLENNPQPQWKEWLIEWHAARREPDTTPTPATWAPAEAWPD